MRDGKENGLYIEIRDPECAGGYPESDLRYKERGSTKEETLEELQYILELDEAQAREKIEAYWKQDQRFDRRRDDHVSGRRMARPYFVLLKKRLHGMVKMW